MSQKFEGHTGWVTGVIHLPNRRRIMTCSLDGSLRIWNLRTKKIARWEGGGWAIALSLDGEKIVSGSRSGAVSLWNIDTGKLIATWTGHTQDATSVCWNRDAERVVSGSIDGTARVWDVESGETVLKIKTGLNHVWAVIFSPDTTMIATGGMSEEEKFIKIWDANTGNLIADLKGHRERVCCLAWTADGRTLISGSVDNSIRTWNTTTWQQIAVLTGHTVGVYGIAISPNGRILASASRDGTARLWNLKNSQPIGSPLHHPDNLNCVSFSPDGKHLATGCLDNNAYTWDISRIVRRVGLGDLLLNDGDKSLLEPGPRHQLSSLGDVKSPTLRSSTLLITPPSVDAINPFEQLVGNDITEDERDNPYNNFFASSQSCLPLPSSDSSPMRYLHHVLSFLHPPANGYMRLQGRLRRRFFVHRTLPISPSHAPTNSEETKPTSKGEATNEGHDHDVGLPDGSTNVTRGTAEHSRNKCKQRGQPIARTQSSSPDDLCFSAHYDMPPRLNFLKRAKNTIFKWSRRQDDECNELQGRRPTVVDVPFAKLKHMYYSKQQARIDEERKNARNAKKAENMKNASASSSWPPLNVTKQSAGTAQAQSYSGLQATVTIFTSSTADADATTPAATTSVISLPDAIIPRAGCWARFWLLIGCIPVQDINGHH